MLAVEMDAFNAFALTVRSSLDDGLAFNLPNQLIIDNFQSKYSKLLRISSAENKNVDDEFPSKRFRLD